MPSIKAYTQYEALAFCQSIAHHGTDNSAFEEVSAALNGNQFISENESYNQSRLSAAALQTLYHDLLAEERNARDQPAVNGDNALTNGTNPRKRKLSTSPAPVEDGETDEQRLLQAVVDKLYARFKAHIVEQIKRDEEEYERIQDDIAQLEREETQAQEQNQETESVKAKDDAQSSPRALGSAIPTASNSSIPQPKSGAASVPDAPAVDAGQSEHLESASHPATGEVRPSPSLGRNEHPQTLAPLQPSLSPAPGLSPGRHSAELGQQRASHPPPVQPAQQSPGAFHRTLPIPSPHRPNYGPVNPQHFLPSPQGHPLPVLPQYPGSPQMPPPTEYPQQKRGSSSSAQGHGSPVPGQYQQQPYPGYSGYPQQTPWPHHMPPAQQYAQPPPFASQPYYAHSPAGRPPPMYQTPHHPQYVPYPQSAPIHYPGQPPLHSWPPPQPGQPYHGYHNSTNVTPMPRSESKHPMHRSRSSTPWKRRAQNVGMTRPASPTRPDREVSPISDHESSGQLEIAGSKAKAKERTVKTQAASKEAAPLARGRQQASATPSAYPGSRSQSRASFVSDTPTDNRRKGGGPSRIKAEPPSTPAALPSDTELPSRGTTGRRGRPRGSTLASKTDSVVAEPAHTNKRKRSSPHESATPPPLLDSQGGPSFATGTSAHNRQLLRRQFSLSKENTPNIVTVTKNFSKTALLFLNDANSHKLAGIFAKPVSERDAPGYKDTVLQPQDLKGIKAAITRGGRAAQAAIEAFEEKMEQRWNGDDKPRTHKDKVTRPTDVIRHDPMTWERSLVNGVYILEKSEDLVPPKGIVNLIQLEMELARVFANAIMFNPLPSSERGFGRSLRLRKRGGDVAQQHEAEDDDQQEESSDSDGGSGSEAGGIISDTREMFEDLMIMLKKWREAEDERLGSFDESHDGQATPTAVPSKSTAPGNTSAKPGFRQSESVEVEDETGGPSTPAASMGTARKRRRVADG